MFQIFVQIAVWVVGVFIGLLHRVLELKAAIVVIRLVEAGTVLLPLKK